MFNIWFERGITVYNFNMIAIAFTDAHSHKNLIICPEWEKSQSLSAKKSKRKSVFWDIYCWKSNKTRQQIDNTTSNVKIECSCKGENAFWMSNTILGWYMWMGRLLWIRLVQWHCLSRHKIIWIFLPSSIANIFAELQNPKEPFILRIIYLKGALMYCFHWFIYSLLPNHHCQNVHLAVQKFRFMVWKLKILSQIYITIKSSQM